MTPSGIASPTLAASQCAAAEAAARMMIFGARASRAGDILIATREAGPAGRPALFHDDELATTRPRAAAVLTHGARHGQGISSMRYSF